MVACMYFELRETDIDRHIQTAAAREILAQWRAAAGPVPGAMPDIATFWDAIRNELKADILKIVPYGVNDWRYTVVGANFRQHENLNQHWRRDCVSDLDEPDRSFIRHSFGVATSRREPAYAIHTAPNGMNVLLWERLVMPCRMEDGGVALVALLHPIEYLEDMIRAVLEVAPSGILRARCVRDGAGEIVDAVCLIANGLAATLLDRPLTELLPARLLTLFPEFRENGTFERCMKVAVTREPCHFEIEHTQGGHRVWLSVAAVPLADGFTLSLADITALKFINEELERARNELIDANDHLESQARQLEEAIATANAARADLEIEVECRKVLEDELRRLALTDSLTGLANRPAIAAQGQALTIAAQRRGSPLCVVSVDVDHFKRVNDTWGHAAGDKVLAMLAVLLQESIRPEIDLAGRLGGEEFVIILPRTDLMAAEAVAERMRLSLATRVVEANDISIRVTASFGVAQWQANEDFDDLLARSDEALYNAKREGRNRVCRAVEAEGLAAA